MDSDCNILVLNASNKQTKYIGDYVMCIKFVGHKWSFLASKSLVQLNVRMVNLQVIKRT